MLITKTPLRVSFAGGGTDLESFYKHYNTPGCVVSCAIDKYIYQLIKNNFFDGSIISYSQVEKISKNSEINHKIIRHIFQKYNVSNVEYHSIADFPSGLGLGASSAFTVGLLKLVKEFTGMNNNAFEIASEAGDIEINQLNEPIGLQDQFGCAIGGIKKITFDPNHGVRVEKINLKNNQIEEFKKNLILFRVGSSRSASKILETQKEETKNNEATFNNLVKMRNLAEELSREIITNIDSVGHYLNLNWQLKRQLTNQISTDEIDEIYNIGIENGAAGGKLLGAGQGGFILFYCKRSHQDQLCKKLNKLRSFRVQVDELGVTCANNLK
ncbi:GHMP kinase [Gammaproteobacteria bacterium]|nr:GHMP kinase [Gammaproteobacteria bacterium]